ncbi:septation protein A [Roseospira visakhapatnamensis]|uniref:Inner membrane-spanning protein YciB n=1 Tax=Roseospira visakhapatnamensis TaxID=390880 RepID=A0A7W6RDE1_9PROT|nr:septation protein A [Roseospira visakhapatnamensis]MBB4266262.1 intracellular septation protein [Roseospira visakhapatnamensis]
MTRSPASQPAPPPPTDATGDGVPGGAIPGGAGTQSPNQWLKLALEMGPLLVFFLCNSWFGLIPGTAVFIVATAVSLLASRVLLRRIPVMPLVGGVFVIVFGGLTVLLDDDLFIKIKPTIVNLLFASLLVVGQLSGRHFLKLVFDGALHLKDRGWRILTWRWVAFFVFLALVNEVVWRTFSSDTWVTFKVFGNLPLTIAFSMAQIPLLLRYRMEDPAETASTPARAR